MRGFLRSLAAEGRAVLVSSHLMSELQDTADHLVVVGRGRVIADTSVADLIAAASGDRVTLRTTARAEAMTVLARRRGHGRRHRPRHAHRLRPARRADRGRAGRQRGAVLRGVGAPGDPGGGLHGAHPGRGRVPRRREGRTPMTAMHPATARACGRARRLRAAAARRVDQVPDRPRLGHRHGRRGAADRRARRAHRRRTASAASRRRPDGPRAGLPGAVPTRAGRRGGDRQLLLRAPAAGRQRQHHRPGDVADRPGSPTADRAGGGPPIGMAWRAAVGQGRDHHQGEHHARDRRTRR